MFGDMMQKLQDQVAETKKRLDTVYVSGEAEGIIVEISGNRVIKDIKVPEALMEDKEALEDLLILAVNRAIENANKINEAEMASSAQGLIPGGIPGL